MAGPVAPVGCGSPSGVVLADRSRLGLGCGRKPRWVKAGCGRPENGGSAASGGAVAMVRRECPRWTWSRPARSHPGRTRHPSARLAMAAVRPSDGRRVPGPGGATSDRRHQLPRRGITASGGRGRWCHGATAPALSPHRPGGHRRRRRAGSRPDDAPGRQVSPSRRPGPRAARGGSPRPAPPRWAGAACSGSRRSGDSPSPACIGLPGRSSQRTGSARAWGRRPPSAASRRNN
jgi:hypothetical protein